MSGPNGRQPRFIGPTSSTCPTAPTTGYWEFNTASSRRHERVYCVRPVELHRRTANEADDGAGKLDAPRALAYDSVNYRLFAADVSNNRALVFNTRTSPTTENAVDILGEFTSPSSDVTADYVKNCYNNGASSIGFYDPTSGIIDAQSLAVRR